MGTGTLGLRQAFSNLFYPNDTQKRAAGDFVSVGSLTSQTLLDALHLNSGSVTVNPETALKLATVFRCVDLLSSTAAYMPWDLYRKQDGKRESATDHPNYPLYKYRPHRLYTSYIWRKTLFTHALLFGNAYARIERNPSSYRPLSFKIYHPNKVSVSEFQDELFYSFEGATPVASAEVIHLKLFTTDGLTGRSVIRMAADSLKGPLHNQRFIDSFMENGARVSGLLTHPRKLSPETKKKMVDWWREAFSGSGKAGQTPILDEGVKYERIGIPPGDFKLLESMNVGDKTICTWFGIPQHLAGILDNATFSNIEHQDLEYLKYSLDPHLVNFEQEVDYKTLRESELGTYYTRLNRNAVLRTDIKTRYESYRTGIQNGFLSPNDAAALEDMNPIAGGDRYFIQQNMMPLDSVNTILKSQGAATKRLLRALLDEMEFDTSETTPEPVKKAMNGHTITAVPADN